MALTSWGTPGACEQQQRCWGIFLWGFFSKDFWLQKILPGQNVLPCALCSVQGSPSATGASSSGFLPPIMRLEGAWGKGGGTVAGWVCYTEIQTGRGCCKHGKTVAFSLSQSQKLFQQKCTSSDEKLMLLPWSPLTGTWDCIRDLQGLCGDGLKTTAKTREEEIFPNGILLCSLLLSPVVCLYGGQHLQHMPCT